ncbi:MAG: hypothetical protein H6993_03295 [Pseudomonadales bacterium]|nr:hypothetical protein [Pseudomonadales bacterium]
MEQAKRYVAGRKGESRWRWLRRDRVFGEGSRWYFLTREGIEVGPYSTRFEAEVEAEILSARLSRTTDQPGTRVVRDFIIETVGRLERASEGQDIGARIGR